jgi:hypothetical protein
VTRNSFTGVSLKWESYPYSREDTVPSACSESVWWKFAVSRKRPWGRVAYESTILNEARNVHESPWVVSLSHGVIRRWRVKWRIDATALDWTQALQLEPLSSLLSLLPKRTERRIWRGSCAQIWCFSWCIRELHCWKLHILVIAGYAFLMDITQHKVFVVLVHFERFRCDHMAPRNKWSYRASIERFLIVEPCRVAWKGWCRYFNSHRRNNRRIKPRD